MNRTTLAAAAVAGLATGPRSFTGLAAVVLATPSGATAQPDRTLAHPAAKTVIGLLALQEWVMDKLPQTPSRLEPLGLATRALGAGAAGAVLARRAQVNEAERETVSTPRAVDAGVDDAVTPGPRSTMSSAGQEPPPPDWKTIAVGAATSAAVALGVATIGVQLRSGFDRLFGRDWPAAGLEDLSSAGLAAGAVYLSTKV